MSMLADMMQENIMAPGHEDWDKFLDKLEGEEGCAFTDRGKWDCNGDHRYTRNLLAKYFPDIDIEETLAFFFQESGHCDCEVVLNVGHDAL